MDRAAVERFSIDARRKLRQSVDSAMADLGVRGGHDVVSIESAGDITIITLKGGLQTRITKDEANWREKLIEAIDKSGYDNIVEQVAYTWFNRLIAMRYMEVNDYLPTHVRVLSSTVPGKDEPDIVTRCTSVDLGISSSDMEDIIRFRNSDKLDDLFSRMFIHQCKALNRILPELFTVTKPYENLLLRLSYTNPDGVVRDLVDNVPEEDFRDAVQIIGWMYQYYNTEQNNLVYDGTLSKSKLPKELIPAATTIYTPDWVVKYMVDNSLGRLWLEKGYTEIRADTTHYLKHQELLNKGKELIGPDQITIIDPCMGSGHILVYAFDLLMELYRSSGYTDADAVELILINNLYGIDVNERAYQLAYFAVMMKARSFDPEIFSKGIVPNLTPVIESDDVDDLFWDDISNQMSGMDAFDLQIVRDMMKDAREYGSIIPPMSGIEQLDQTISSLKPKVTIDYSYADQLMGFKRLLKCCLILSKSYDVVVTNPPYLGSSRFDESLSTYAKKNHPKTKSDLSMMMYEVALTHLSKKGGYVAFITTNSWMFLSTFEDLRRFIIDEYDLVDILDLGSELFEGKVGHNLIVSWITKNTHSSGQIAATKLDKFCYSLKDCKEPEFFNSENEYMIDVDSLLKIPGAPIAYWVSEQFIKNFDRGISIDSISMYTGSQNITANNEKYLRMWWEVQYDKIGPGRKWVFYAKGGDSRKFYGNILHVVDWSDEARAFYSTNKTSNLLNSDYWYKDGITYTDISSKGTCFRYLPSGCVFDKAGPSIISLGDCLYYCIGFLNSNISITYRNVLNPTIHTQRRDINNLPLIIDADSKDLISGIVKECVDISKKDWDSNEFSSGFSCNPLILGGLGLLSRIAFSNNNDVEQSRKMMSFNEEKINSFFNGLYGMNEKSEVSIDLRDVDICRDMKQLISYAVGCMFGRYSLESPGLQFTGGKWTQPDRKYPVDPDNIIPINDNEYFGDDIVTRLVDFIRLVFGEENLEENLKFIASALEIKGSGTARDKIRKYFLNDFYKDHLKMYSNLPIYWLFDSGKENGFKALIYMHRYDENLIGKMRQNYLLPMQKRYTEQFDAETDSVVRSKLQKKLDEIAVYDLAMELYSSDKVSIDLDDGVKVNYAKFQNIDNPGGKGKINLLYKLK